MRVNVRAIGLEKVRAALTQVEEKAEELRNAILAADEALGAVELEDNQPTGGADG